MAEQRIFSVEEAIAARHAGGKPVYDKDGNLIGRTGKDPKVEYPSPSDILAQAFQEKDEKRKTAIGQKLNEAGKVAWEARHKVRPTSNYLNFDTKLTSAARLQGLRGRLDEAKEFIARELSNLVGPENLDFHKLVDEQLREIEKTFATEPE